MKKCSTKLMRIEGVGEYKITCPENLNGEYDIVFGASMEVAEINGSNYGWFIDNFPILKRETNHGIYTEKYDELFDILETSSFWQAEITNEAA